jgi:protein-S-isoprenylcysteine O-methyltransferase Ste14
MLKIIIFIFISTGIIFVSWKSLLIPRSHGFFRFLAWECMAALLVLNVDRWFVDAGSWHQIVSWSLLFAALIPLVFGVRSLTARGEAARQREGEPQLMSFEKTTQLVTTGVYRYIRHPLYSSLLLLNWGIFFKSLTWPGLFLTGAATVFLFLTAKADEAECIQFFCSSYA